MRYEYKDPTKNGYIKITLSRKQHNQIFKNQKTKWSQNYEYYISDNRFRMDILTSRTAIALMVLLFPVNLLIAGLGNFKELLDEYSRLFNEKKSGAFLSDECWKGSDLYEQVKQTVNT